MTVEAAGLDEDRRPRREADRHEKTSRAGRDGGWPGTMRLETPWLVGGDTTRRDKTGLGSTGRGLTRIVGMRWYDGAGTATAGVDQAGRGRSGRTRTGWARVAMSGRGGYEQMSLDLGRLGAGADELRLVERPG
jgi:hypothetical protein